VTSATPDGRDAAEAILLTDQDQGTPPTDAVRSAESTPRGRKNTGRDTGRQRSSDLGWSLLNHAGTGLVSDPIWTIASKVS